MGGCGGGKKDFHGNECSLQWFLFDDVRLLFVQAGMFRSNPVVLQLYPGPQVSMLRLDLLHCSRVRGRAGGEGRSGANDVTAGMSRPSRMATRSGENLFHQLAPKK